MWLETDQGGRGGSTDNVKHLTVLKYKFSCHYDNDNNNDDFG